MCTSSLQSYHFKNINTPESDRALYNILENFLIYHSVKYVRYVYSSMMDNINEQRKYLEIFIESNSVIIIYKICIFVFAGKGSEYAQSLAKYL